MAGKPTKSSAKGTKKLAKSDFAYPEQKAFPIDTPKRARAALSRSAQKKTSGSYGHVAKAVQKKYGSKIATKKK